MALATVPIERRSFATDEDELEAVLLENANRDKTTEQKVREAACWQEIEAEKDPLVKEFGDLTAVVAELANANSKKAL